MKKLKENSLGKKILLQIGESCKGLLEAGSEIFFDHQKLLKGYALYSDYRPWFYNKAISQLKRGKYLRERKGRFYLAPKGRVEIIKTVIKKKKDKKLKWDKRWRAVIFDIPELNRKERNFLRKELRWMGFIELQKSIWVFPYDIEKELLALLELWKTDFGGDIKFLRIERMISEERIKKIFGLK